jgi:hypothetical protein
MSPSVSGSTTEFAQPPNTKTLGKRDFFLGLKKKSNKTMKV